jgi:hypothetical protein
MVDSTLAHACAAPSHASAGTEQLIVPPFMVGRRWVPQAHEAYRTTTFRSQADERECSASQGSCTEGQTLAREEGQSALSGSIGTQTVHSFAS